MGTKISDLVTSQRGLSRNVFTLSNGNCMIVVLEGANVVKVYETSAADRKTGWTQRASVTVSSMTSVAEVSGALFTDNSLGIAVKGSDATNVRLSYFKMTYAGYSVSAIEAVASVGLAGNSLTASEIDISDNGAVAVGFVWHSGQNSYTQIRIRNTGGTWGTGIDTLLEQSGTLKAYPSITLLNLGASGSTRRLVWVSSAPYYDSFTGYGVGTSFKVYTATYDETTGTISGIAERAQYLSNYSYNIVTGVRNAKLFRGSGTHEYHLGLVLGSYISDIKQPFSTSHACYYARGSWDGTTWSELRSPQGITIWKNMGKTGGNTGATIAMTCGSASISYYVMSYTTPAGSGGEGVFQEDSTNNYLCGMAQLMWGSDTGNPGTVQGYTETWLDGRNEIYNVFSGGTRNLSTNKHDVLFLKTDSKPYHQMAPSLPVPTSVTPDNGQNVATGSPDLIAVTSYIDFVTPPSKWKAEWQISQDSAFVTGVRSYEMGLANNLGFQDVANSWSVPKTLLQKTVQDNTKVTNPPYGTPYYPLLNAGAWYIRARIEDTFGNQGAWTSTTRLFTIGHPPVAVPIAPTNNAKFEYGGSGTKSFTWEFTDPSLTDTQTAYQLRIKTGDALGTVVLDTGKVVSTSKSVSVNIPVGNKNQTLYWEVRLWDTDDAAGIYSTGATFFQMVDPATAAITAPTSNQILSGGSTTLNATVSASGGRVVKQYQYQIFRAGQIVWSSNVVLVSVGNAGTLPYIVPPGVLENFASYSVRLTVVDDAGIQSQTGFVTFSTSWTPALSATVFSADSTNYNTLGYVRVSWTDANREAGFVGWNIYRKADIVDQVTGITLTSGTYELVYQDNRAVAGTYTWDDYYAPSNHRVSYLIKQVANRGGFFVESQNTSPATTTPVTDGYWLLEKGETGAINAYKIPLVVADDFTDEQEEAEYTVIGRGRHVDKGDILGPKGSLTVQLRDNVQPLTIVPTFNGTFDTDILGWTSPNGTILARDTGTKFAGAASLKMTDTAAADINHAISDPLVAYPGKAHSFSMRLGSNGNAQMNIYWYDQFGAEIRVDSYSEFSGGGSNFTLLAGTWTAPDNAVTFRISAMSVSTLPGGISYLDSVTVSIASATGYTARQRRLTLLAYQQSSAEMYLRNPFGDVFKVNTSGMSVGRIAGVGVNEFCDVTIPYAKVG
jgi:hypothetical protein